MNRRKFLAHGGVAVASAAAVQQAVAQTPSLPSIRWRCASSFPKSLDTIFGGAELIAKRVKELTSGKFEIRVFAAGEALGLVEGGELGTGRAGAELAEVDPQLVGGGAGLRELLGAHDHADPDVGAEEFLGRDRVLGHAPILLYGRRGAHAAGSDRGQALR